MGLGNAFVAPIADKVGRKPIAVLSLVVLAIGMLASGFSQNSTALAVTRVFTGIGIGSAVAGVNVIVAEYASERRRSLAISFMTIGFPVGATLGGLFSIYLINAYGWRSTYYFGAIVAVILAVPVIFWLPESIDYLISRRPTGALARVNRILLRMGYPTIAELPVSERADDRQDTSLLTVFRPPYLASTTAASLAYFATTFTVYFLLSWTPKLLTQLGFSIAGGISASLLMNMAGVVGCVLFGLFAKAAGPRRLAAVFLAGLFGATLMFGAMSADSTALTSATVLIGACLFTSVTALYVVVPVAFPSTVRSTGTGFAMSIGRIGSIAGPFVAGVLLSDGWSRQALCAALGAPALLAAISLYWIGVFEARPLDRKEDLDVQLSAAE
jgi:predicted MFS family arabinose efflux permease